MEDEKSYFFKARNLFPVLGNKLRAFAFLCIIDVRRRSILR